MKRIFSLVLVLLMMFSITNSANAAVKDDIELMYIHTNTIGCDLVIDQSLGIATCSGMIVAKSTYPVKVSVHLQIKDGGTWTSIRTWSATGTLSASCTNKYAIYSGYEYRVFVIGYVYNSAGVVQETVTIHKEVNYPSN